MGFGKSSNEMSRIAVPTSVLAPQASHGRAVPNRALPAHGRRPHDTFEPKRSKAVAKPVHRAAVGSAHDPVVRTVTFIYDAGPLSPDTNLRLKGSWNSSTGEYSDAWGAGVPMLPLGDGRW